MEKLLTVRGVIILLQGIYERLVVWRVPGVSYFLLMLCYWSAPDLKLNVTYAFFHISVIEDVFPLIGNTGGLAYGVPNCSFLW
jgi:hypothetical protein